MRPSVGAGMRERRRLKPNDDDGDDDGESVYSLADRREKRGGSCGSGDGDGIARPRGGVVSVKLMPDGRSQQACRERGGAPPLAAAISPDPSCGGFLV